MPFVTARTSAVLDSTQKADLAHCIGRAVAHVPGKSESVFKLLPLNCHKASFHSQTPCRIVLSRVATCTHVAFRYWGVFYRSASEGVLTCTHR